MLTHSLLQLRERVNILIGCVAANQTAHPFSYVEDSLSCRVIKRKGGCEEKQNKHHIKAKKGWQRMAVGTPSIAPTTEVLRGMIEQPLLEDSLVVRVEKRRRHDIKKEKKTNKRWRLLRLLLCRRSSGAFQRLTVLR